MMGERPPSDREASTVPRTVSFRDFLPGDVVQLSLQPSQHVTLGLTRAVLGYEDGEDLAQGGPAWTGLQDGRVIACFGAKFLWPVTATCGGHAVAWALLGAGLGEAHLAVTRYTARMVAEVPIARLEAIVRADVAAEACWARLCGFKRRALLRQWGPEGKPHLLFERLR